MVTREQITKRMKMKNKNYIKQILLSFAALAFFACTNDDFLLQGEGNDVTVTFHPAIETTRAIGDASRINELIVAVFEGDNHKYTTDPIYWEDAKNNGVDLTLIEGHEYNIIFWAQNSANTAYELTDEGKITVNYDNYLNAGFEKMEQMDAFYGVSKNVSVGSSNATAEVTLTRPFAQLNFADNATRPDKDVHTAYLTLSGIATAFDPIRGEIVSTEDKTFTFRDFITTETLSVDGSTYYYITNNYLFAPEQETATIAAQLVLKANGKEIKNITIDNITLEKNKKTNVLGAIVQQPEQWSVWDGTTTTPLNTDAENRYIISSAANVAWLTENASTLEENKTFILTTDIDMNGKPLESISLPAGSTIDGGEHTIKGLNLSGALFGDATSLTVKDLTIEDAEINAQSLSYAGVLVNTLKGSSLFSGVTISLSDVKATEAAGGMVGYIVRTTEKNRSETLEVKFDNCHVKETTISGNVEGHFVGLLSGYDNNETLTFNSNCTLTTSDVSTVANEFVSPYSEGNEGAWLATNDYSQYNGWLGNEKYYRAKVFYGNNRFIPRWDGKTATDKADLLLYNGESNKYEVYSPFDLAGVRKATATPAALYLMENVDMFGQGADGKYNVPDYWTQSKYASEDDNYFKSFSTIAWLDGNNNGIYNVNINTQKVSSSLYYGGFIQYATGTTTHKNIKFHNSCVVVPLVVLSNKEDKGSAGMLVSNIEGTSYTMDNVHAYGCKIFALQKVGGLVARVAATQSTISNCSVNNGYIENYECKEHKENFTKSASGVTVSGSFYSHGEVGGMFGFVQENATIDNCQVKGTTIYAFGEDDLTATLKGSGFMGNLAVIALQALGYYKIPGRHVGTFIGDIRTTASGGGTITMTNVSVDADSKCTKQWDKHNNVCPTVGRAYFVAYGEDEGEVYYNGTKLKLMNCTTSQNRDQ